jgi:hypothetical protein
MIFSHIPIHEESLGRFGVNVHGHLHANRVMKDGKINKNDIPHIMVIIVKCTNNLQSLNLTYNELFEILEEVILFILNHFKVVSDLNEIKPMIHSCVELVMLQPKVKNCLSTTWTKIKNMFKC